MRLPGVESSSTLAFFPGARLASEDDQVLMSGALASLQPLIFQLPSGCFSIR